MENKKKKIEAIDPDLVGLTDSDKIEDPDFSVTHP